jgi:hypothetical protein
MNHRSMILMWLLDQKLVGLWTILGTWNQDICTHTGLSHPTLLNTLYFLFSYIFSITPYHVTMSLFLYNYRWSVVIKYIFELTVNFANSPCDDVYIYIFNSKYVLWMLLFEFETFDLFLVVVGLKSILCAAEDSKTKRVVSRSRKIVTIPSLFPRQVYHVFSSSQFHFSNQSARNKSH